MLQHENITFQKIRYILLGLWNEGTERAVLVNRKPDFHLKWLLHPQQLTVCAVLSIQRDVGCFWGGFFFLGERRTHYGKLREVSPLNEIKIIVKLTTKVWWSTNCLVWIWWSDNPHFVCSFKLVGGTFRGMFLPYRTDIIWPPHSQHRNQLEPFFCGVS